MWQRYDPAPAGLVDKVLAGFATDDLDAEYELLHLVERSQALAGTRGGEALTLTFAAEGAAEGAGGDCSVLLRISPLDSGSRRLDGWVHPAAPASVSIRQQSGTTDVPVDASGRFEVPRVATGLTRLWLRGADNDDVESGLRGAFATPTFEL